MPLGLMVIIFLAVTLGSAGIFLLLSGSTKNDVHKRALRRLGLQDIKVNIDVPSSVLKKEVLQQQKSRRRAKLNNFKHVLDKSGCGMQLHVFLILTLTMAVVGGGATWLANRSLFSAVAAGGVLAIIPYIYVRMRLRKRIKLLTEQFPDALDLLTNTLRAGQAFTTGLMTVADEMPDPIAGEFRATFEEQNYGAGMSEAMTHMAERVGTMDMDFFVTAVNIQRETGGNLAEILDNLGRTIRMRFKILGHIRTLTAQGRLSGFIIGLMPLGLGLLLSILNPEYMGLMFESPIGKLLLIVSGGMQLLGFLWINKIVKIKV